MSSRPETGLRAEGMQAGGGDRTGAPRATAEEQGQKPRLNNVQRDRKQIFRATIWIFSATTK